LDSTDEKAKDASQLVAQLREQLEDAHLLIGALREEVSALRGQLEKEKEANNALRGQFVKAPVREVLPSVSKSGGQVAGEERKAPNAMHAFFDRVSSSNQRSWGAFRSSREQAQPASSPETAASTGSTESRDETGRERSRGREGAERGVGRVVVAEQSLARLSESKIDTDVTTKSEVIVKKIEGKAQVTKGPSASPGVLDALETDRELTKGQKETLRGVYCRFAPSVGLCEQKLAEGTTVGEILDKDVNLRRGQVEALRAIYQSYHRKGR
jgi:hypothetical protein